MPYPNFHAARVINPGEFQADSFRTKEITPGVEAIMGKIKGKDVMIVQSYHFDKEKFTAEQAKKWLKKNEVTVVSFDAAVEAKGVDEMEIKVGARNSAADMAVIQKAHDLVYEAMHHMRSLGAVKPVASPYKSVEDVWFENEFPKGQDNGSN